GGDGRHRPRDCVRSDAYRPDPARRPRPRPGRRADVRRRRAVRARASLPGPGLCGEHRALRPRCRVDGRRGGLREPLPQLLVRRSRPHQPGPDDDRRRPGRLPAAQLLAGGRGVSATPGYILLEDGTRFDGELCAGPDSVTGEVVFNTSMTGYQESVTDPSYAG